MADLNYQYLVCECVCVFITSAKEVMFSLAFVCLLAGLHKLLYQFFTKLGGKVAHGPRKKPLDVGVNPDHVT